MKNKDLFQIRSILKKNHTSKQVLTPYNEILAQKYVFKLLNELITYEYEICLDSLLKDDLDLDSLDLVQISMIIESDFSTQIEDSVIDSWVLVNDIVCVIKEFYKTDLNPILK